jgi:hypothetical protein
MKKIFAASFWVKGHKQSCPVRIAAFINKNGIQKEDIVWLIPDPNDRDTMCLLYYADANFKPEYIEYV